jgi:hypothetical protein
VARLRAVLGSDVRIGAHRGQGHSFPRDALVRPRRPALSHYPQAHVLDTELVRLSLLGRTSMEWAGDVPPLNHRGAPVRAGVGRPGCRPRLPRWSRWPASALSPKASSLP